MLVFALAAASAASGPMVSQAITHTIAGMTLEQKAAQLQSDAPALPAAGLPAMDYWDEGLHGLARNGIATVFPQAIGLAATWDAPLLQRVGDVISTEARAKFNALPRGGNRRRYESLTIWSPNINIFRDPRWGRGQETYGEDPYLTGQLAVHFITGLQGDDLSHPKAIATPKHLAVHSGPEAGRDGFDVDVSPRDLAETYTPAFRAALVEGHALSVMCAYNAVHGVPVCASDALLKDRVRGDWKFDGLIVSDCDAVGNIAHFHFYRPDAASASAAALQAGTDLDCGRTYAAIPDAVRRGLLDEAVVDRAVARVFTARARLGGAFGTSSPWDRIKPSEVDTPAHRVLAREAAEKSIVLLKNDRSRLPLAPGSRIAVIGPNADSLDVLEANYHGTASAPVTPLEGLRARFGSDHILYAQGASIAEGVPVPVPETALSTHGAPGLSGAYFADADRAGQPVRVRQDRRIDFDWDRAAPVAGLSAGRFGIRWTGEIRPVAAGRHAFQLDIPRCFDCEGHDAVHMWIDDRLVASGEKGGVVEGSFDFPDTRPHAIRIEIAHASADAGLTLRWSAPAEAQRAEAVRAAAAADVVVAFVGLSPAVEGEALQIEVPGFAGGDRTEIELPATQRQLLEAVAATGKPIVLVLLSGSAVALPWAKDHADAILAGWYPGEDGGDAIARILAGDANPSGRLPVTFYGATRDLPAFADYNMRGRTYRFFAGTPLYPFGHGLSFTRFTYADPHLSAAQISAGQTVSVEATVSNVGDRSGEEVVQAYLSAPAVPSGSFNDPVLRHALVGFQRIPLQPGKSGTVRFVLDARALSSVDHNGERRVRPGKYTLWIGGGQPGDGDGVRADFTVTGETEVGR